MPERKIGGENLMKRAMRWVLKNGIPIALGIVATVAAVNYANEWRGYNPNWREGGGFSGHNFYLQEGD